MDVLVTFAPCVYFLRGSLPWYSGKSTRRQRLKFTRDAKIRSCTNPHLLLHDTYPNEFALFLDYTRALQYEQTPNYKYLRTLFSDLLSHEGHIHDHAFDWCTTTASPDNGITVIDTKKTTYMKKRNSKPLVNGRG